MAQNELDSEIMSIQSAARYLGVSVATLRRMDKKGILIPFRTPGRHRRYSRQMLDRYLEDSRRRGPREKRHDDGKSGSV